MEKENVKYVSIYHSIAYTAQEIAASVHVKGRQMAKTVMVRLDGKLAMAVLPASHQVDFELLKSASGAHDECSPQRRSLKTFFRTVILGHAPPQVTFTEWKSLFRRP